MSDTTPLRAPLTIEYPFTRTVGPVQSAFLTGLREGIVLGIRRSDGTVLVPPVEYDPATAEELRELVDVSTSGTVTSWAWEPAPDPRQPLDRPFAWALIRLDGADTSMLHVVDAGDIDAIRTGARVQIRWAEEREGAITDIACFDLVPSEGEDR